MKKISAAAFGKIIISGEHAGVYGHPMIAGPISKKVTVTVEKDPSKPFPKPNKSIAKLLAIFSAETGISMSEMQQLCFHITGNLPRKAGLGSSAAYAHAFFKALAQYFSLTLPPEKMFHLVQQSEKNFHGNPSGVDAAVTTAEMFLQFQKNADGTFEKQPLSQTAQQTLRAAGLLAVYSGPAAESTKEMVGNVAALITTSPAKKEIMEEIGRVTTELLFSLENGIFPLEIIKENHQLLTELAVVGPTAKKMIAEIEAIDGAAKVTGAGGAKKGSGYLLAAHADPKKLTAFVRSKKWKFFPVFEKL
jgi:mevalonate kinase